MYNYDKPAPIQRYQNHFLVPTGEIVLSNFVIQAGGGQTKNSKHV